MDSLEGIENENSTQNKFDKDSAYNDNSDEENGMGNKTMTSIEKKNNKNEEEEANKTTILNSTRDRATTDDTVAASDSGEEKNENEIYESQTSLKNKEQKLRDVSEKKLTSVFGDIESAEEYVERTPFKSSLFLKFMFLLSFGGAIAVIYFMMEREFESYFLLPFLILCVGGTLSIGYFLTSFSANQKYDTPIRYIQFPHRSFKKAKEEGKRLFGFAQNEIQKKV